MKPGNQLYTTMYDADSRRTTMQLGLGTTRQYQFDARGQLTTQIELNGATPICTIVDGYDPVGNRVTRNLDGNPATWSYDDLYRLTGQAKAGQVCTYTLDGVGNMLTMWEGGNFPMTFTHNAADRLVTMVEGANLTTYAWTGYGALESEITGTSTTTNTYSGQDQLIGVVEPDGKLSTYTFDGDGLRRTAWEPRATGATSMVWDGSDYLYLKKPGLNASQVVVTLDSEIVACGSKDLLTDPLGSLVKEISAGASLGNLIEGYPYGQLVSGTGTPTTPYVYVGAYGYYNDSQDRDYVRARELMKKLGRWMRLDPLWPYAGAYNSADSSPTSLMDRNGLFPEPIGCGEHTRELRATLGLFCALISKNPAFQDCIKAALKKCACLTEEEQNKIFGCAQSWCNQGTIRCNCRCPDGGPNTCACALSGSGSGSACEICLPPTNWTGTGCPGTRKFGRIGAQVASIMHELGHCCLPAPTSKQEDEDLHNCIRTYQAHIDFDCGKILDQVLTQIIGVIALVTSIRRL